MIMALPEASPNQELLTRANQLLQSGAPAGTVITEISGKALFRITSYCYMANEDGIMEEACMLKAQAQIAKDSYEIELVPPHCSIAIVTLSDKGAAGKRTDESGAVIGDMLKQTLEIDFLKRYILPDNAGSLKSLLCKLALVDHFNMIITTGGTGVSPRDITPQVTTSLLTIPLPGIAQAMMSASLQKTPNAMISRAAAGLIDKTLIINLPGSVKAVKENLAAILPGLSHCLAKANGDMTDCGLMP